MDHNESGGPTNLREYLAVFRRRKWVLVASVLLTIAATVAYLAVTRPTYKASADVLVPQQQAGGVASGQGNQLQDAGNLQRYLSDQQQFAEGDAVETAARSLLGYAAAISVSTSTTADVLTFTASGSSPAEVAKVANAYAQAYISASRTAQVNQFAQQITALQASIAALKAKKLALSPADPQAAALQQSIVTLTQTIEQTQAASELTTQVGPTVVVAATVPRAPVSPKRTLDCILAAIIGLVIGITIALLQERLDDGIRTREIAEQIANGRPILGLLPLVEPWQKEDSHHLALVETSTSPAAEAYRALRISIQFLNLERHQNIIGVTSSIPGEGKTTAVANLAVSFALAGQRVIVVSADLRKPRVHEFFGLSNETGLTSVLLGRATLDEAAVPWEQNPLLTVLPSGPTPPNPAEVLGLESTAALVENLAKTADIMLIDCPPILPVADALLVSHLVDGMLVVAATDSTSRHDLQSTFQALDRVNAPVRGLILNRVPYDGYAYSYGYTYGAEDAEIRDPQRQSTLSPHKWDQMTGPTPTA